MTDDKKPKLLAGGNPQIPKGFGDGPVQDYIAALPDWKHGVGRELDQLITKAVPDVRKAVKWNSPFYGVEVGRWFLSFHAMTRYIKVAFFDGTQLDPMPPEASKQENVRYLHIPESGEFDRGQFSRWVKAASKFPGAKM